MILFIHLYYMSIWEILLWMLLKIHLYKVYLSLLWLGSPISCFSYFLLFKLWIKWCETFFNPIITICVVLLFKIWINWSSYVMYLYYYILYWIALEVCLQKVLFLEKSVVIKKSQEPVALFPSVYNYCIIYVEGISRLFKRRIFA